MKKKMTKLILCVRKDLKMGRGKIASQCSHAVLGIYKKFGKEAVREKWEDDGEPIVCLSVNSEDELFCLEKRAEKNKLTTYTVCDNGSTQVESGSRTVLAIGPGPSERIDKITGHLKLL